MVELTTEQKAKLEEMDKAAEKAQAELEKLVAQYPKASQAFGTWMKTNVPEAGLKRLARLIAALA